LVVVLGFSRMVAVRFATDTTRLTTLQLLTECLEELGGAPTEVLTDRDPALMIGSTPSGRPVFAPEWVDLAEVLGIRPRACRPYRAKTKGKVERVVRELKEDLLAWATGQPLPSRPVLADYDRLAAQWCTQVVATPPATAPLVASSTRPGRRSTRCSARFPIGCCPAATARTSRPRPR
jgi:transposase